MKQESKLGSAAVVVASLVVGLLFVAVPASAGQTNGTFISTLQHPVEVGSTVPANGDVNPYGIAVVPSSVGKLVAGDTLVSNFNDMGNTQGTGTTVVEVSPSGALTPFAEIFPQPVSGMCPGGIGLTTSLAILPGGWVFVGSLPAGPNGALPSANPAGCLLVLNSSGTPVETWSNANINGPWDMTAVVSGSKASLFVSNALSRPANLTATPPSGLCTIVRVSIVLSPSAMPVMTGTTVVGTGFVWRANKAAFVQSPTGLALGRNGTLYVAETVGSHVTAIPNALSRKTPVKDGKPAIITAKGFLNGPLGMTLAPNGDLIVSNGNDGNVVEISPQGRQLSRVTLVKNGAGDLFGLTISSNRHGLVFVNDGTNAVDLAQGGSGSASATSTAAHITISNFKFSPATLTVQPGAKVSVTNKDGVNHTLTSDTQAFDTGQIASGQTGTFTAPTKPGTYSYRCTVHPYMTGKLTVS